MKRRKKKKSTQKLQREVCGVTVFHLFFLEILLLIWLFFWEKLVDNYMFVNATKIAEV